MVHSFRQVPESGQDLSRSVDRPVEDRSPSLTLQNPSACGAGSTQMKIPSSRSAEQASAVRLEHSPATPRRRPPFPVFSRHPLVGSPVALQSQRQQKSSAPAGGNRVWAMSPATKALRMVGSPDIVLQPRHARGLGSLGARRQVKRPQVSSPSCGGEFVTGKRPVVQAPEVVHPYAPGAPDTPHSRPGTGKSMCLSTLRGDGPCSACRVRRSGDGDAGGRRCTPRSSRPLVTPSAVLRSSGCKSR